MRLRMLRDAGRLGIPLTTGLLIGIGETLAEGGIPAGPAQRGEEFHGSRR